jgi:ribosomal subunit interface protein
MNNESIIIDITYRQTKKTPAIAAHIKNQIYKLERHFGHIVSCHVVLNHEIPAANNGGLYSTSITVHVPHATPKFSKSTDHTNLYASIADAFNGMQRQLKQRMRHLHNHSAIEKPIQKGVVRDLFPLDNFGFIEDQQGVKYYFNSDHVNNEKFKQLRIGQSISFTEVQTLQGLQAHKIKPCGN